MLKVLNSAVLIACAVLFAAPVSAETLAEKEAHAVEVRNMDSAIANVKKQCGVDIPLTWDWNGFTVEELNDRGASTFCGATYTALAEICTGSPDGLKAVQNSVKSVMCLKASPRRVELKNGQLIFGIDYNAANNEEAVRTFLKNNI